MNWQLDPGAAGEPKLDTWLTKEWCDLHGKLICCLQDAAVVIDRQTRVLCWNAAAEQLYGLSAGQMLGRPLEESHQIRWLKPGDEEAALECLHRTGAWRGENVHIRQDGRELYVECAVSLLRDERGAAAGLLAVVRKIKARHDLEELLQTSQERLLLAQKVAHLGWFDWDVKRNVSLSSDEAQLLHGLPPGSFHGGYEQWKQFVYPEDLAEVEAGVNGALRSGGEHSHVNRVIWPDQSVHWLQSRIKVFLDDLGQPERMVGVFLDVTDLKQAEELARMNCFELERRVALRTAALQESRHELQAFVYSISHDLRAPLRAMEGFAQAVLEDDAEQLRPESQQFLDRVKKAARRMDALICALVDYTAMQHREIALGPVSLERVVDGALFSLRELIQQKDAIVSVQRPLAHVIGNSSTLELIAANLISNGLKFVASQVRPEIRIWTEEHEQQVKLFFQDNGLGIEPEYRDRVFRVFERLHDPERYSGVGIGLALARKGVERMNGQIYISSERGQGSCFCIQLPKAPPRTGTVSAAQGEDR